MDNVIHLRQTRVDRARAGFDQAALTVARSLYARGINQVPVELVVDAEEEARRAGRPETEVALFGREFAMMVHRRLRALQPARAS